MEQGATNLKNQINSDKENIAVDKLNKRLTKFACKNADMIDQKEYCVPVCRTCSGEGNLSSIENAQFNSFMSNIMQDNSKVNNFNLCMVRNTEDQIHHYNHDMVLVTMKKMESWQCLSPELSNLKDSYLSRISKLMRREENPKKVICEFKLIRTFNIDEGIRAQYCRSR